MKTSSVVLIAVLLSAVTAMPAVAQSAQQLFQQALTKERAEGKLEEAIQLYRRIVEQAGADRVLASRALLQLGRCHEKLGEAGARESYERLLREYADQPQVAAEARMRLAALGRAGAAAAAAPGTSVRTLPNVGLGNDLQAISPDGTKAVVGDYTRGQNLAIFDFASKRSRLLTAFDWRDAWATAAAWSPDGRQIAYMQAGWKAEAVAELRVATLTGEPRTVFRNDAAPGRGVLPAAWLPDGKTILAVVERADRTTALGLVSVADGRFTPLRSFGWAFRYTDLPSVSPDGRFVAFVERIAGSGEIHVVSVDGGQSFRVTDHPADDREPVWAPDGRHLAFISSRLGADALWLVPMHDGSPRAEAVKVKDGLHDVQLLDWSPRGIAAVQFSRSWDLYTIPMDPKTRRSTADPQAIPYARTGRNVSPVWSPDGRKLAFISSAPSDGSTRYVVVLPENGEPREFRIPTTQYEFPQAPYDLRWFGNGQGLGFSGSDAKGEPAVFRLTLATGEWKTFPIPVKSWTRIEWNDDGSAFYFARHGFAEPGGGGIFERKIETGEERRLYAIEGLSSSRAHEFSPDRRWLAFQGSRLEGTDRQVTEIVIVNVASGESRTLTTLQATIGPASPAILLSGWSPDGKVVVQRRGAAGDPAEWMLLPPDGSAGEPLSVGIAATQEADGLPPVQPIAKWSPDGSRMVFVRSVSAGGAFIIEHPLASLPRTSESARRR